MQQQTINAEKDVRVTISSVPGDLRVAGWDRGEIMAKTAGDELGLTTHNGDVQVKCDEDLIIYLPHDCTLEIEHVKGDANLQALRGTLSIGPIAGDLTMHDVGNINLETVAGDASLRKSGAVTARLVSGDFSLRVGEGPIAVEEVGCDASIRDVKGEVAIQNVGADLYLRNVLGNINVVAGADIALYLEPKSGNTYTATAGDDIIVRLPPQADVRLHLVGTDPDSIQVNIPGFEFPGGATEYDLTIGEETENIARMNLNARDDLLVTSQSDAWDSAADFGVEMNDFNNWGIPPIPPLPPDFSERINRRVQAAMERAQSRMEAAGRHAEFAGRKVEAAVRRAEAKARAAEVRARRGQVNLNLGRWQWDLTPSDAAASQQPSDEERLTILRMLQEKKITLEDAEKLLGALEGK